MKFCWTPPDPVRREKQTALRAPTHKIHLVDMMPASTLKILTRLMASVVALAGLALLSLLPVAAASLAADDRASFLQAPGFTWYGVLYAVLGLGLVYVGLRVWFRWSQPAVRFMMSWFSLILFIGLAMPLWEPISGRFPDSWRLPVLLLSLASFFVLFRWGTECLCQKLFPESDSHHSSGATVSS